MEIELIDKKDQELLSRIDITFRIKHPRESTPKRDEVRDELATQMNVKKARVIIDHMKADFGKSETVGFAKVYKSEDDAIKIERDYILVRNKLKSKSSGKKEEKKETPAKKAEKETPEKDAEKETSEKDAE